MSAEAEDDSDAEGGCLCVECGHEERDHGPGGNSYCECCSCPGFMSEELQAAIVEEHGKRST